MNIPEKYKKVEGLEKWIENTITVAKDGLVSKEDHEKAIASAKEEVLKEHETKLSRTQNIEKLAKEVSANKHKLVIKVSDIPEDASDEDIKKIMLESMKEYGIEASKPANGTPVSAGTGIVKTIEVESKKKQEDEEDENFEFVSNEPIGGR